MILLVESDHRGIGYKGNHLFHSTPSEHWWYLLAGCSIDNSIIRVNGDKSLLHGFFKFSAIDSSRVTDTVTPDTTMIESTLRCRFGRRCLRRFRRSHICYIVKVSFASCFVDSAIIGSEFEVEPGVILTVDVGKVDDAGGGLTILVS